MPQVGTFGSQKMITFRSQLTAERVWSEPVTTDAASPTGVWYLDCDERSATTHAAGT